MLNLRNALCFLAVATVGTAVLIGCAGQDAAPSAGVGQASEAWMAGLDDNVVAALSELSDADRRAALSQKVCPVSDMALGSMGAPLKLTVNGQEVFLCCDGCEAEIKANPDQYLAKLNSPE